MARMEASVLGRGEQVKKTGASWRRRAGSGRSGRDAAGLLLGEFLSLHVRPDLLRHLGRADGPPAHDRFHGVLAALEVDRVAAKRLFLRHALCPPSSGCGIRRPAPPDGPRVLSPGYEGAQGKNTTPRGPPTRGGLPGGGIPPGGVDGRYRRPAKAGMTSRANQDSCSLNSFGGMPSAQWIIM